MGDRKYQHINLVGGGSSAKVKSKRKGKARSQRVATSKKKTYRAPRGSR